MLVVLVPVALVQIKLARLRDGMERLVNDAFVAKRLVVVAFVEVTLVKTPVDGVVLPMAMLLSAPDVIAAASIDPVESIVKPFTTIASEMELFGSVRLPVTARFVLVVFVPVAFPHSIPEGAIVPTERFPNWAFVA